MSVKFAHRPLLPPGRHVMTLSALRALCVDGFELSTQRSILFYELSRLICDLDTINCKGELWIDGSFLTEKLEPNDLDLSLSMTDGELDSMQSDAYYFVTEIVGEDKYSNLLHTFLTLSFLREDPRKEADTSEYWSEIWGVGWDNWLTGFAVIRLGDSDVQLKLLA